MGTGMPRSRYESKTLAALDAQHREDAHQDRLHALLEMEKYVEDYRSETIRIRKICGFIVLVLSVLTSGSLWLLMSDKAPHFILWVGAIASTVTSGLTAYVAFSALVQKSDDLLVLSHDIGALLGRLRSSHPPDKDEFWGETGYKGCLGTLRSIEGKFG
jgi:hypothetical protein